MTTARKLLDAREYLRISDDKSGRLRSVDEQRNDNERAAAAEGWRLGAPYEEAGAVGASRLSGRARPGFAALMADLQNGRFGADILIMWEPSRGSRRLSEWARFIELLQDNRVQLFITSHGRLYDMAIPRDRRTMQEDGTDSEYESAKISSRTLRALDANAAAGLPHGAVQYGYKREYEVTATGKRIFRGQFIEPDTAPIVQEIFERIEKRHTLKAIAADLNRRGVPTSRGNTTWKPQIVRDIALRWAYLGKREHNGEITDAAWPALVTAAQFYAVRDLLTDPARRQSRANKAKHLLTMIATCGVCGSPMSLGYNEGPRYFCRDAGHVRIQQADLDGYIEGAIKAHLSRDAGYPVMAAGGSDTAIQAARDELAGAKAHHADLMAQAKARTLSLAALAALEPDALASIEAAERHLAAVQAPPALVALLGDPAASVADRWEAASIAVRREIVRMMFEEIKVNRHPAGGRRRVPMDERVTARWRE